MQGLEEAIKQIEAELKEKQVEDENPEEQEQETKVEKEIEEVEDENPEEQPEEQKPEESTNQESEEDEDDVSPEDLKKNGAWSKMRKKLKAERDEKKRILEELQALKEQRARDEGYREALKPKEEVAEIEKEVEPDKDFDRESWLEWKLNQQEKELNKIKEITQTSQKITLEQAEREGVKKIENEYRKVNPNYDDALQFLKERESKMIKLQYPQATDAQIEAHLENEKVNLFKRIYNSSGGKKNPAEVLQKMAVEAYGYQPAKKDYNKKPKVDFDALRKNQKKSLSFLGGSEAATGKDKSVNSVFSMTLHEIAQKGDGFLDKIAKQVQNEG